MVRASRLHRGGYRFESCAVHTSTRFRSLSAFGSKARRSVLRFSPFNSIQGDPEESNGSKDYIVSYEYAAVAHAVERISEKDEVASARLARGTNRRVSYNGHYTTLPR